MSDQPVAPFRRVSPPEEPTDPDTYFRAFTERCATHERPVRARIAIQLLTPEPGQVGYKGWPGVSWTVETADAEDGPRLRRMLDRLITLADEFGLPAALSVVENGYEEEQHFAEGEVPHA